MEEIARSGAIEEVLMDRDSRNRACFEGDANALTWPLADI
jgi:hypothetical protein